MKLPTADEWIQRWPHYCRKCNGWGLFSFVEMHGFKHGTGETITDPCEEGPISRCHRCGEMGLSDDSNGPCRFCGWNFDDGLPEYDVGPSENPYEEFGFDYPFERE